ncbi:MAG: PQQ-binding-like beta-propeller repeat protein [Planctomycetota bacterium]|nr:PQQ-binding-like beta-propeller repeat protein [Planctomycetota bacterium]
MTRMISAIGWWTVMASLVMAANPDWPGWRGKDRDGKSPDTGLLKEWPADGPKLLWKNDGIGTGFSSVAVTGGKVYITGDQDGKLMAFALDLDGQLLWKAECGKGRGGPDGSRASPVIDGGKLYLIDGHGLIGCYDTKSGKEIWSRDAKEFGGSPGGWGYAESVLIYKDQAIVKPGGKNCIVTLNKTNGETGWQSTGFEAGPEYGSCIAVTFQGQPMIITGTNRGIVGVDANNGSLLWSNDWSAGNTANCPTPAYADGYVFWANGYGRGGICLKLKKEDGKVTADVAWTTKDMDCHHGGYVIHEGHIYGNHGGVWNCFELKSGEKKWSERAVGKGSLCFADGMLYLFSENAGQAGLATCSPASLELKGTFKVAGRGPSWAHPVVVGGRLYLRFDTNLYCFDVRRPG